MIASCRPGAEGRFKLGVAEPAGGVEQPVAARAAAGTALQLDRSAAVHACRVAAGALQLDMDVQDVLAGRAACTPVRGANLVEATQIGCQDGVTGLSPRIGSQK